jgi:hypothetical protein
MVVKPCRKLTIAVLLGISFVHTPSLLVAGIGFRPLRYNIMLLLGISCTFSMAFDSG